VGKETSRKILYRLSRVIGSLRAAVAKNLGHPGMGAVGLKLDAYGVHDFSG
jgi:hypothetical protein